MPLTTGQILENRYQILAILGKGGMGIVYQAYDPVLQRTVAIKVLPPQLTLDAEFVARFQREAIASANLRHPNIVTVYDVGQQAGEYFIIMEYLEGATLEQALANGGPMPMAQASKIVDQVASALDHAHSRGIVHRDVKPSNIMLDAQGHATLMDFGLVRAGEGFGPTRSSVVIGTPEYMAPEQVLGQAIDRRTDVYALGLVVYEMLSGKTPFAHTTPLATAHAHAFESPPPLRTLARAIPESVEAVVMTALAKDPAARYQSAGDLARDFSQAIGGTTPARLAALQAQPTSTATSSGKKQSSSPAGTVETVVMSSPAERPPTRGRSVWPLLIVGTLAAIVVLVLALRDGTDQPGTSVAVVLPTVTHTVTSRLPSTHALSTDTPVLPTDTPIAPTNTPLPPTNISGPPEATATQRLAFTSTPVSAPMTPSMPQFTVSKPSINVRSGPGTIYPIIGTLKQGQTSTIVGKSQGQDWYVFDLDGRPGWVSGTVVSNGDSLASVPVVSAPPTPASGATIIARTPKSPIPTPALLPAPQLAEVLGCSGDPGVRTIFLDWPYELGSGDWIMIEVNTGTVCDAYGQNCRNLSRSYPTRERQVPIWIAGSSSVRVYVAEFNQDPHLGGTKQIRMVSEALVKGC